MLVTPRRKLGGHLAVRKRFLHFFGEFLVEGTGGSSVFNSFDMSGNFDASKPDQIGVQKQKFLISLDVDSSRRNAVDNMSAIQDSALQKQTKTIKRHQRWDICKVATLFMCLSFCICMYLISC